MFLFSSWFLLITAFCSLDKERESASALIDRLKVTQCQWVEDSIGPTYAAGAKAQISVDCISKNKSVRISKKESINFAVEYYRSWDYRDEGWDYLVR